ncbi:hypothetical protein [Corynebacterium belfantii]|uniref:hypothetical protein n=1 Tax=Corynebacterium belfantii TaxID=2014537 RepID=UPI000BE0FE4B|nr:hypothetical protein [Corynebacterium belfantii]SNW31882.1 hypothetical protein FRC0043_01528 [Corynebacterium belfantii]STC65983.1 sialidase-1 [Corynebacterium diphtheriae]
MQAKLQEVETQLAESREKAAALVQQAKEQSKIVKDVTEQVVKEVPGDKEDAAVPAEKKGFSHRTARNGTANFGCDLQRGPSVPPYIRNNAKRIGVRIKLARGKKLLPQL